jgi:hypothetical protein
MGCGQDRVRAHLRYSRVEETLGFSLIIHMRAPCPYLPKSFEASRLDQGRELGIRPGRQLDAARLAVGISRDLPVQESEVRLKSAIIDILKLMVLGIARCPSPLAFPASSLSRARRVSASALGGVRARSALSLV